DSRLIYRSPDGYLSRMAPLYGRVKSVRAILGAYRVHGTNAWAHASGGLESTHANRWLRFDRVLCDAFNEKSRLFGYTVTPYEKLASVQRAEHRLIGFRADKANYPYPSDNVWHILRNALYASAKAPNISVLGRLLWMAWFAALAFAPYRLVSALYG